MKKTIITIIEFIGGVILNILYFLPFIYAGIQLIMLCINIPEGAVLPNFLIADSISRFLYTVIAICLWCVCYTYRVKGLNYLLGLYMLGTFCFPNLLKATLDFCLIATLVVIGLLLLAAFTCGIATPEPPEVRAKRKEENERRWQEEKARHEEFVRKSTPKWVFEYAIDRGGLVEYIKFDENNPTNRIKSSFRGKLISYSNLTITVLDGNQTCVYYADGHRVCRPAPGH